MEEATITELQAAMQARQLSSRELVEVYLRRIEAYDRRGPELRSILEINPDAPDIADALDGERVGRGPRGPLHGIPVLLKDNIDTADRMTTTAGSLALSGSIPPEDAFVARKLREAGAVLLGKANMSEWANFRSEHSSSGWSSRGGQCLNPYALDRSPCGSSSGSAVAVAAGFCAVAVGTETDGSIMCPSAFNSVAGIKPTVGLVSRSGIIPISHTQDTAGPMARTVADAATLLGALVGLDPEDEATRSSAGRSHTDYTRFLGAGGLRGARIGVAREVYFGYSERADALVDAALGEMERLGATIVDPADLPTARALREDGSEYQVLLYEFKAGLNRRLAGQGPDAPVRSLREVIEYNEAHRDTVMPYFSQNTLQKAEEKGPLTEPAYLKALETCRRLSRTEGIDAVMDHLNLDALVAPTTSPPFKIDLVNGDNFIGGSSQPAAVAGYPSVTVPAGYAFGLPVGITFWGRAYSEPVLLKLAYAYEQATKCRRSPALPGMDLPGLPNVGAGGRASG